MLNFDGHQSNTCARVDAADPSVLLPSVAELLQTNTVFAHVPKAHTTSIGTQQLDLRNGVIQKGCANFDSLMARQVAASLDLRGKYKGRISTAVVLRLIEKAFFEMGADEPAAVSLITVF